MNNRTDQTYANKNQWQINKEDMKVNEKLMTNQMIANKIQSQIIEKATQIDPKTIHINEMSIEIETSIKVKGASTKTH